MKISDKKIAIVCDWIKDWWGAELVLEDLMEIFPQADIFTSIFFPTKKEIFQDKKVITSFIQKIPFINRSHKIAWLLRPLGFESFDLSKYDIVISSTSAESKWVITKPDCLHICYCHTPTRYFWSHYHEYKKMLEFWWLNFFAKTFMPSVIHRLRKWDFCAAQRPDFFIANSENTQKRIQKYYARESEVITPWIKKEKLPFSEKKEDFYFYNGRCIPYKKFDLLVDAFNKNGKKLILSTSTNNKLFRTLQKKSNENILWKLGLNNEEINKLHTQAKAFLFPAEEDFWLVPIFAMACGTPVIAYKKGGVLETVKENETGIFFSEQTPESLNETIEKFEKLHFDYKKIRAYTKKFDSSIFKEKLNDFVKEKWKEKKERK